LEIEEIPDNCFEHYYFNKYVHSEPENQCKIFRHLDGAARVYLQDNNFTRKTSKLPDKKSYKKIKLWKIDTSFVVKA
jgi:hypothetical protein